RKAPIKMGAIDTKGDTRTKSSDTCVKVNTTFKVLSCENEQSFQEKDRVIIEECDEDNEEFYDVVTDKYTQYITYEDKSIKKTQKERARLKCNNEIPD
ncbi:hypothetical protein MKW98_027423, partial [Papaver atlanticum]